MKNVAIIACCCVLAIVEIKVRSQGAEQKKAGGEKQQNNASLSGILNQRTARIITKTICPSDMII